MVVESLQERFPWTEKDRARKEDGADRACTRSAEFSLSAGTTFGQVGPVTPTR